MIQSIKEHPTVQKWSSRLKVFRESENGKLLGKLLRYAIQIFIFGSLIYQIAKIGWWEVLQSLPLNPLFYILLVVHYFVLPVSEQYIYRMSLDFTFWEGLKVFVKKKILNSDVYVYTGEAYFFWWGKKNLKEDDKYIFNVIKDNNIISSIASTFMAIILLVIFLYVSQENLLDLISIPWKTVQWILIGAVVLVPIIIYLLRFIISFSAKVAAKVFGVHVFRFVVTYALEVCQWIVVLPLVPIHIWFVYLGSKMITNRIPIPSVDIAFISISIQISNQLGMDEAEIAGLMIAVPAINKTLNLLFYSMLAIFDKKGIEESKEDIMDDEKAV